MAIRLTRSVLAYRSLATEEIFHQGKRVASHLRSRGRQHSVTAAGIVPRATRHTWSGIAFTRNLKRNHGPLFASNPLYRTRAGQFLTALLPPKPRRGGQPGIQSVTAAIRLLRELRRLNPAERRSTGAGENDGHVIRLFGTADPVRQGAGDNIADAGERLVAMLLD